MSSDQTGRHPKLSYIFSRHLQFSFRKPVSPTTLKTLAEMTELIINHKGPIILDSGCGTGESTIRLASLSPESLILGIDKSSVRLRQARRRNQFPNAHFFQVLLEDCWAYAYATEWPIDAHFLLYPNPWPKKKHLTRRWYAHPIFKTLLLLSPNLQIRTNWSLYAREFVSCVSAIPSRIFSIDEFRPTSPQTAFERKYVASGHTIYKINVYPKKMDQTLVAPKHHGQRTILDKFC